MAKASAASDGKTRSAPAGTGKPAKGTRQRKRSSRFGHVLIVEDEALLAGAIEEALLEAGASSIEICSTTEAALAALSHRPPEVLILDVNLADRNDGWAVAELVVELSPRHPRIVFSTGSPERIPPEIAELGRVLAKPYAPSELIEALKAMSGPGLLERLRGAISAT
jgi:DNA-binding response OmpR family regulator